MNQMFHRYRHVVTAKISTMFVALIVAAAVLSGCGRGPQEPHVPYHKAAKWHAAMTVEVLYSWDLMKYRVPAAPQVTHLVKVRILQGPPGLAAGQEMILPYSDWATEAEPPARFTRLTMSPAMWLRADHTGLGR